ncbi:MAG: EAL domain-containing protein [Thermoanaerobaculaceae bacterium]|nr:EAL domain-containing protein [Thermoanaerobaculaceae bacterium]
MAGRWHAAGVHSPDAPRPQRMAKGRVAAVTSSGFDASRNLTERAARIAGLRSFETPTLEAVEHRRLQLWLLTLSLLFAAVVALVTVTFWHDVRPPAWVPPIVLRGGLLATVILFCAYAIEKELQLRRLTKLLIDERVLTAALTNRLREVSTLLEAAKAMNLVLDLEEVLRTILECANELLDTHDGSIMLVHGDGELRTVSVSGSSGARGARLKFGEGVAGQVAQTREPVLVTGVLEPEKWPAGSGAAQPPTSSMSVPLVYRDVLLGVLNVNAAPGRAYTRHQLRALSLFGEQAAAAIANARLYEEQRLLASQNVYQALHDLLTNLPNRALFLDRVNHALSRRRLPGQLVAILFLDLDDFKLINDSLGHAAGDEVLIGFADRLRTCVRSGDAMARFGGDEFAVLIEDVTSAEDAAATAERILALFAEPFSVGERRMWLRASIGIAVEGLGASSAEALLRNADTAKNVAKTQGKGRIVTFEETMHADALQRLEFEGELQHALEHGQLAVHYQPMFSLAHGRAIGVEALVRWEHPARGLLPASAFLPLAEQAGLMVQIDRWVLRRACETLQALRSDVELPTGFLLSVNISPTHLQDAALVDEVAQVLRDTGIEPGRLVLEITEGAILLDSEKTAVHLNRIKALGVKVALDDFGTGYSSLSHLRRFPVDIVKIDRVFVDGITTDKGAGALVQAIVRLGRGLNIEVIAEGIEHQAQADALAALQCPYGQGWYLSIDLPAEGLADFLRRSS